MEPGEHEVRRGGAGVGLGARRAGLEIRDCVLVIGPGGVTPTWLLRAPLRGTVVEGTLGGVGGLHIDACRVGVSKSVPGGVSRTSGSAFNCAVDGSFRRETGQESGHDPHVGRWPSNTVLVHGPGCRESWACGAGCLVPVLDEQSRAMGMHPAGSVQGPQGKWSDHSIGYHGSKGAPCGARIGDAGGASRFFAQCASDAELVSWLGKLVGR